MKYFPPASDNVGEKVQVVTVLPVTLNVGLVPFVTNVQVLS
jgi:hypothetical protein